jgi:hypothetical protein
MLLPLLLLMEEVAAAPVCVAAGKHQQGLDEWLCPSKCANLIAAAGHTTACWNLLKMCVICCCLLLLFLLLLLLLLLKALL